ncbi:MAG: Gfo/Idh/MocA family oxidoreductase [Bacteroidales bacterium]|nr:Gfo/Idh/MocA family oxidoreductase [Bacteroidales bacterium]
MKDERHISNPSNQIINVGLVGFGMSGQIFHAPFIQAHQGFRLKTIVTSGENAKAAYPKSIQLKDFSEALEDSEIDLMVICTPHSLHFEQAKQAMHSGKGVVIEKPVALNSDDIKALMTVAAETDKKVFPYHNRRWDGDFLTVKHLIKEGFLGDVVEFESHFDRYSPTVSRAEWRYNNPDGGGTLFDLGPHLIDQAISLFGKPEAIWCKLYHHRPGSKVNDSFDLKLHYAEMTATLKAGIFVREPGPRFQVHGTLGSYMKYGLDTQESRLKKGRKPDSENLGKDLKQNFGILHSMSQNKQTKVVYPTFNGDYMGFYNNVYNVLTNSIKAEVKLEDALLGIQIIEAAFRSNSEERTIYL